MKFKYLPVYFMCLCGVISHALLLIAFAKDPLKCFRNSATYLVANLAVSDLTISFCGPFVTPGDLHWSIDITWRIALLVSMENIVSIAAHRFLMVAFPFKHHSWMSGKKTLIWIILIWMPSSCLLGKMISFRTAYSIGPMEIYMTIIAMLFTGLLYMLTLLSLRKQTRNLARHNPECESNSTQRIRELRQRRFLNTIILVACIAVIGTVPCSVSYRIFKTKGINSQRPIGIEILWCFVLTLFYGTFAINPLVYFLRLPNYRKTFYSLYWRRNSA